MVHEEALLARGLTGIRAKGRDYALLLKPNLSFMVVFTSVIGYLMAPGIHFGWAQVLVLFTGGILVTGGANTINQILERKGDALMKRTAVRPLPGGRMTVAEAWILAAGCGVAGALMLGLFFNPLTGLLSFTSLLLYAFAYTPMKRVHPIAVFIGAIPGALPPLLGWVAATGSFGVGGFVLFLVQFFWQFPHYWAIAWVGYDEYQKAGISMLPTQEKESRFTAMQCVFYSAMLIPLAIMSGELHLVGGTGMTVSMLAALGYIIACIVFYQKNDLKSAKRVMFASFFYLPAVMIAMLADKVV